MAFMEKVLEAGHAEKAPKQYESAWYTPHPGVHHPKKPFLWELSYFVTQHKCIGACAYMHLFQHACLRINICYVVHLNHDMLSEVG